MCKGECLFRVIKERNYVRFQSIIVKKIILNMTLTSTNFIKLKHQGVNTNIVIQMEFYKGCWSCSHFYNTNIIGIVSIFLVFRLYQKQDPKRKEHNMETIVLLNTAL